MSAVEGDNEAIVPVISGETGQAIVAVVGLALWAQLVIQGLGTEVSVTSPSPIVLAAYVAPPIVLIAGTYLGSLALLLFLFPLAMLPAVAFVPSADAASYFTPWSMARVGATFALYQALAAAWGTSSRIAATAGREVVESVDASVDPYRTHVLMRLVPFLLLWLVPTYAIFFDAAVVGTFNQSFGDAASIAQVFVSTTLFLAWSIVGYTSFIVPALNLEYDRRKLRRAYQPGAKAIEPRRSKIRIGVVVGLGCAAVSLILLMTS